MEELYADLVKKLQHQFGKFNPEHNRFEKANNTNIARELGYSDAQFSRLINKSATEGEYQRAIKNIDRILKIEKLEKQLQKGSSKMPVWLSSKRFYVLVGFLALLVLSIIVLLIFPGKFSVETQEIPRDHTIKWTFESSFINPYVKLNDLPDDCNYPCYKYQGKWKLHKSYKLPFFRERNGYHYLATGVDMYARCMAEKSETGNIFEGYEYQKHEIWYDTREWPMDSFLTSDMMTTERYQSIDFRKDKSFIKLADLHTFFRSEFELSDSLIRRTGKVIGRDLEMVSEAQLLAMLKNEDKVKEVEEEVGRIIRIRLKDFSVPIACEDAALISDTVEEIKDGDLMSFDCALTTSRMAIDYTKTYELVDQYIKNDCVSRM